MQELLGHKDVGTTMTMIRTRVLNRGDHKERAARLTACEPALTDCPCNLGRSPARGLRDSAVAPATVVRETVDPGLAARMQPGVGTLPPNPLILPLTGRLLPLAEYSLW